MRAGCPETVEEIDRILANPGGLFEHTHDVVIALDLDWRANYWNRGAERVYGWKSEEAVGKKIHELLQSRFPVPQQQAKDQLMLYGTWEGEVTQTAHDARQVIVQLKWVLDCAAGNRPVGILEINNDVTEQRRAQEALQESQQQWRLLADALPHLAWIARPDGSITFLNRRWVEYTGMPVEQALGRGCWQAIHPDDLPATEACWAHSLATGSPYETEHRLRRWDGAYRWHIARGLPARDASGNVTAWFGTCTDISDLRRAREIVRQFSIPVLLICPRMLIVPLIGEMDADRTGQLNTLLLPAIRHYRARAVVIDLTGVPSVDSDIAGRLLKTAEAARLLGAATFLTGISRQLAQALAYLSVDVSTVRTSGDLQSGVEQARVLIGL